MSTGRLTLRATEGAPVQLPAAVRDVIVEEAERVVAALGITIGGVTRLRGGARFDNLIGTISTPRAELEIVPKTRPGDDWIRSVLSLLDDQPIAPAGELSADDARNRPSLLDALAHSFATRVSAALRGEGPPTMIGRHREASPVLRGRLDTTRWASRVFFEPHLFPVEHQRLTVDNDYARTLAFVSDTLARASRNARTRSELDRAAALLSPGGQPPASPPANAIGLSLPEQWQIYAPAWRIAQLVLAQRSPLGWLSAPNGLSVAIEPWPLLERLLERALRRLAADLRAESRAATAASQTHTQFIKPAAGTLATSQFLLPDAVLLDGKQAIANFEAKYRDFAATRRPLRGECYQAMAAARALGSPIAVLVYPGALEHARWDVMRQGETPTQLHALGLDMFSYSPGSGDVARAQQLRAVLENVTGTDIMMLEGEAA